MRTAVAEQLGLPGGILAGRAARTERFGAVAAFIGACLTGLLAQVQVRLPLAFTPVPFTGQVLGVLICGAFLGGGYGLLSQAIYVGAGAAGLPWFAGMSGGFGTLQAVSGGYLIGFVLAAYFLGACLQRSPRLRTFRAQLLLMLAAVGIIHLFGVLHLALLLGVGPLKAFELGSLPFLAGDAMKIFIAASLGTRRRWTMGS